MSLPSHPLHRLALAAWAVGAAAGCTVTPPQPPAAGSPLPTHASQRIDDAAVASDHRAIAALQERLKRLNDGGRRVRDAHHAKAQCWLDFAFHEYHQNDRTGVIEHALRESGRLIEGMEQGRGDLGHETPLGATAARLRPELWQRLQATRSGPGAACAAATAACGEVRLVWAGHEYQQTGWRHASPWIGIAEDLAAQAEREAAACVPPAPPPPPTPPARAPAAPAPAAPAPAPAAAPSAALPQHVHFALDRAEIIPSSAAVLDGVAQWLRAQPQASVLLRGHTDLRGAEAHNRRLAQRRAEAVRDHLQAAGIAASRIRIEAVASAEPSRTGGQVLDHARNRRVQMVIEGGQGAPGVQMLDQSADLQPER